MDRSEWQDAVLRELDAIHRAIEKHNDKLETLAVDLAGIKIKTGIIATLAGALASFLAMVFR